MILAMPKVKEQRDRTGAVKPHPSSRGLRVAVAGHSFITRLMRNLQDECYQNGVKIQPYDPVKQLGLDQITIEDKDGPARINQVGLWGVSGGQFLDARYREELADHIWLQDPTLVLLELGTNDLACNLPPDTGRPPATRPQYDETTNWSREYVDFILDRVKAFVQMLLNLKSVTIVGWCKVTARRNFPANSYVTPQIFHHRREHFNRGLAELEKMYPEGFLCHHHQSNGLRSMREPDFSGDGVHPTTPEAWKRYKLSLKTAVNIMAKRI